jgi:hypothetical protein
MLRLDLNRRTVWSMLAAVSLLASCQPLPDKPAKGATREVPAPSQSSVDSSPTVKPENSATKEALAGRYQMISTPTKILMLDTTTGRTWFLAPNSVWQPLEIADGYKNETPIVADLVAESLIAPIEIYNPNNGRSEPLTEAEKKQRVDAAVKQAIEQYENTRIAGQFYRKP